MKGETARATADSILNAKFIGPFSVAYASQVASSSMLI
jgi:hypothetical protein